MELKLAKTSATAKPKKITLEQIESNLDKEQFYYFDRENEHKELLALKEYFEEKGYTVILREAKYALGDLDYIYELHIL